MYAIVDIRGKQFYVRPDAELKVPLLDAEEGSEVTFDRVLMVVSDDDTKVGTPVVEGASVSARVTGHGKDNKVINFVKKRRKGYSKKRGHRQDYTLIQITKMDV